MVGALTGVRVVDLSEGIAGGYATKLLADAGADVVKIERPGGDPLRRWSASCASIAEAVDGALFQFLHTSKRSVVADLQTDAGRDLVARIAVGADLLVESLGAGGLAAVGLSPDRLRAINPTLSVVSISGFGQTGPWKDRPWTEFTLQGHAGSLGFRGTPERPPISAGGRLGEWATGAYAAISGEAARRRAQKWGHGEYVDLSALEVVSITLNAFESLHATLTGDAETFIRDVFSRSLEVPSIEPAKDGWVGLAMFTAQMWQDFLVMIERTDLAEDEELALMLGRWPRRQEVYDAVHPWTTERTAADIVELASLFRIPAAIVGNGETIPHMDHFVEVGTFVPNPSGGFLQPRVPYRLSAVGTPDFGPAPRLGEHTAAVTAEVAAVVVPDGEAGVPSEPAPLPFEGLRVVDMTQVWAGPLVTHLLRAMGADVVKIEAVQRPDSIRFASSQPMSVDRWWEYAWLFHGVNAGKRSITLDLGDPEGKELLTRMIAEADIVIENYSPRVLESFGLDYDAVAAINPRAIMVRMPGFGLEGPWRDRGGMAQTMEQLSGLANLTGYADGPPIVPRGPCDALAGLHACFALQAALEHRERTGEGMLVESIMVEGALNVAAEQVIEYSAYGALLEREGNRSPAAAPQGLYPAAGDERWLAIAVADDDQWFRLRTWLGDPEWARDPALDTHAGRRAHQDLLDARLAEAFATLDAWDTAESLMDAGVPAADAVLAPLMDRNPQLRARGFFETAEHPVAGPQEYPGLPFKLGAGPDRWNPVAPPTLGQHNDEVLGGDLGLSDEQLADLRARNIIGERPRGL